MTPCARLPSEAFSSCPAVSTTFYGSAIFLIYFFIFSIRYKNLSQFCPPLSRGPPDGTKNDGAVRLTHGEPVPGGLRGPTRCSTRLRRPSRSSRGKRLQGVRFPCPDTQSPCPDDSQIYRQTKQLWCALGGTCEFLLFVSPVTIS